MSGHRRVTAWMPVMCPHLPHLRQPQARVLAWGSVGRGLARSGALTAVAVFLAVWRPRTEQTGRQAGRACGDEAAAKRGSTRQARAVAPGVVLRLGGVRRGGQGTPRARALEATTWGRRFTVLALSVV